MKICFKCGIEKELSEFYSHPKTADKHLNKCKNCTKKDTSERILVLKNNMEWVERERERGREKYFRLNYRERNKPTKKSKQTICSNYYLKYPEKKASAIIGQRVAAPKGSQKHHWSYRKEDAKDVLFLSVREHNIAHRFMIYDKESMMYKTKDGVLLNTKAKHLCYITKCIYLEQSILTHRGSNPPFKTLSLCNSKFTMKNQGKLSGYTLTGLTLKRGTQ